MKITIVALASVLGLMPPAPASSSQAAAEPPADSLRSRQLLRLDCGSNLGRREITLFANGTVRLREGPPGEEAMGLGELGPAELEGYLRRFAAEDLSEAELLGPEVRGLWIERCTLDLALPDRPARSWQYGRYDSLPLGLARVQAIAQELPEKVTQRIGEKQLPPNYQPEPGDVLERVDGYRFRVVGPTADKKGLELEGLDQPLTLLVRLEDLRNEFVALVVREESFWP